ncbi:MAG: ATP-binding cassette domain-containing protein [Cyanobacteria bacterium]|jgi:lipopolysaccharide transport system ATP-binding protein|nr:ATP-binding cassette domain-containing protein [Cyanobacteria bacterium GSL.Bin1]
MQEAIIVENLGKWFSRYHSQKPVTLMEAVLSGLQRMKPVEQFWALKEVSFTVASGEMLGVIGHNGAGKSTLLHLLGGVVHPTEGRIRVQGRIGALLDLGAGMHGDLTGRENIFVMGIAAGLTRKAVTKRLEAIMEFAELEAFIDNPVRTYSTGMMMRLAFSVAVHTEPEVLLVDEFLSVGDLSFQAKCLNRIAEMKDRGCAIVLVSHDVGQVERLCDRALWLKNGTVLAYGDPALVAGQYTAQMRSQTEQLTPDCPETPTAIEGKLKLKENRFGSLEVEIETVQLLPQATIHSGEPLCVEIRYQNQKAVSAAIFGVSVTQSDNQKLLEINTAHQEAFAIPLQEQGILRLQIDRLDLASGEYFIDVGIYEKNWSYAYDFHWHIYSLLVKSTLSSQGVLNPPMHWEVASENLSTQSAIT